MGEGEEQTGPEAQETTNYETYFQALIIAWNYKLAEGAFPPKTPLKNRAESLNSFFGHNTPLNCSLERRKWLGEC